MNELFRGKNKMNVQKILILIVFASFVSKADISSVTRAAKAVVHYDFETAFTNTPSDPGYNTVEIADRADAKFGAPLNLKWYATDRTKVGWGQDLSGDGYLWLRGPTIVRSMTLATKINTECKKATSTGLTVEVEIENNETVEERTGEFPANIGQPLRIVSMSKDFTTVNFALGQFYDGGDRFMAGATSAAAANLFRDPLISSNTSVMIQGLGREAQQYKQKVIFTVNKKTGFATLYLTDRKGNLYPAIETTDGFSGGTVANYFDRWNSQAFLNIGNDYIPTVATLTQPESFKAYAPNAPESNNPNRYWKGKLYRLAIYCEALDNSEILGSAFQIVKNEVFPIVNVAKTPNLIKASEIYERLTGTKTAIFNPMLKQMEEKLNANDAVSAAALVTEHPSFYNITVRNFANKMSNRDETIAFPLNDFAATIIGVVRDNISAKELLSGNYFYAGDPAKAAVPSDDIDNILRSNSHYEALDLNNYDLKAVLVQRRQMLIKASSTNGNNNTGNNNINNIVFEAVENPFPAGLLTTRQWAQAHLVAGTNRRAAEFTFREFLCSPIENMADSAGPEDVIGRDIDRNPGGSRSKFTTSCRACHTILDGFRPAFGHVTFSNGFMKHSSMVPTTTNLNADEDGSIQMRVHSDAPGIKAAMNHNEDTFIGGKTVKNDQWVNNANSGTNRTNIGWTRTSGKGLAEFGKAIAESKAFPKCMAKRVFFSVCKREAEAKDEQFIKKVAEEFSSAERNYNIKYLFQRIVANESCLGGK
ncbi:MAG: hypothetical protein JNL11_16300 [Bdellovibrionaceae bacterium]|nr:hypothetical protein [Pseudobdellovibrionaceae bacterium]